MSVTLYHNPRCSKSRKALALLKEKNVELQVVEYLKTPPTEKQLDHILNLLQLEPLELMRKQEKEFRNLKLDDPSLSRDTLIEAMVAHPILMQRPIAVADGRRAAVGRPPEAVLAVL